MKSVIPTDFPSLGAPWLISGIAALFGRSRLANRMPPIANVAISNVPGPQFPLYLAGAKMLTYYPVSIATHSVALNITVQSYNGSLDYGLIACRRAMPDVARLAELMRQAHEEMLAASPAGERGRAGRGGAGGQGAATAQRRHATRPQRRAAQGRAPQDGGREDASAGQASRHATRGRMRTVVAMTTITVHHLNNSRSQRVLWLLEELGLPYEIVHYERDAKTMLAPASLREVHPLGKSPVITDGDNTLAESGAIIEYLVDTLRQRPPRARARHARARCATPTGCTTPRARRCRRC